MQKEETVDKGEGGPRQPDSRWRRRRRCRPRRHTWRHWRRPCAEAWWRTRRTKARRTPKESIDRPGAAENGGSWGSERNKDLFHGPCTDCKCDDDRQIKPSPPPPQSWTGDSDGGPSRGLFEFAGGDDDRTRAGENSTGPSLPTALDPRACAPPPGSVGAGAGTAHGAPRGGPGGKGYAPAAKADVVLVDQ